MESSSNCAADFGFSPIQMSPWARELAPLSPWTAVARSCSPGQSHLCTARLFSPYFWTNSTEESRTGWCKHSLYVKWGFFPAKQQSALFSEASNAAKLPRAASWGGDRCPAARISLQRSHTRCLWATGRQGGLAEQGELRAPEGKVSRAWEVSLSPKRCCLPSSHKCFFNHSFTLHNLNLQLRKQNIRLFLENGEESGTRVTNLPGCGLAPRPKRLPWISNCSRCQSDGSARMLHLCTKIYLNIVGAAMPGVMEGIYPLCNDIKEQQK